MRFLSVKTLLIVVLLPYLTLQWWDVGHMLTAAIAEIRMNQLNSYVSVRFRDLVNSINNLVDEKSRTFIEAACWPDDLKDHQYNMELWNSWHFIDKPYVSDGTFPMINLTQTILHSVNIVGNASKVLSSNVNKTTAERALFARYLVHVIGDIHQPLHSVSLYNETFPKGDLGGNSLHIKLLNGSTQNLHSFWDSGAFRVQNDSWYMVRPLDSQNTTALKNVAMQMIKEYGDQVEKLAENLDPAVWAYQSFKLAQNTTYVPMFTTNQVSQEYSDITFKTAQQRITLAGYRIANMAISIYQNANLDINSEDVWERLTKDTIRIYDE